MTDHPTSDEQLLLASAYMDGELTAEEQARAEADPVVMSTVEELRAVRRQLAIAVPPDVQRRDTAISAALAAAPPIPSIAARRRARWMAPLAAAAAAVVVVVGGVVLLRASDDTDDDAGDQASLQVTESAQLAEDDAASGATTPVAPQEASRAETSAAEAESGEVAAPEATQPASATEEQATAGAAPFVIVTQDDLRAFAVPAAADASSATSVPLCRTDDRFVGFAQVQGVDGIVDVEIYDVAAPAERIAVDRQSCEVVLRTTP